MMSTFSFWQFPISYLQKPSHQDRSHHNHYNPTQHQRYFYRYHAHRLYGCHQTLLRRHLLHFLFLQRICAFILSSFSSFNKGVRNTQQIFSSPLRSSLPAAKTFYRCRTGHPLHPSHPSTGLQSHPAALDIFVLLLLYPGQYNQ
jgi:hypothetical protein